MFRLVRIARVALALIVASGLATPDMALAQEGTDSPFSLGFQSSWPSYGISGRYEVSEKTMIQGVIGALGTVTNFSGRLLYDFQQKEKYDFYAHGTVGMWRWGGNVSFESQTSVGFGGGVGMEFDLQELFSPDDEDFPPLYWNIEIGAVVANFDNYNFSAITHGGGQQWAC